MITWGLIASGLMFVRMPLQFYALRLLLGMAEAGFFPGIIYYMGQWWPAEHRARATSRFMIAAPLAGAIGNPLGAVLLRLDGRGGMHGWQWLFLVEGIPAVVLGVAVLWLLTERIEDARWLSADQRGWLAERMRRDQDGSPALDGVAPLRALLHPMVWLLTLPYFLISLASYGYYFWGPTIIRDTLHATTLVTGLIAGGIAPTMIGVFKDMTGSMAGTFVVLAATSFVAAACLVDLPRRPPLRRIGRCPTRSLDNVALWWSRRGDRCMMSYARHDTTVTRAFECVHAKKSATAQRRDHDCHQRDGLPAPV